MLPRHVAEVVAICARQLTRMRLVEHTASDALIVAIDSCERTMPTHIELLTRLYVPERNDRFSMKIRADALALILNNSRSLGVSRQAYVHAIATLFSRVLMASAWRDSGSTFGEKKQAFADVVLRMDANKYDVLDLPSARKTRPILRTTRLRREKAAMRYHKYIEDFRSYMQERGGLDSLLNQSISINIHAKPIKGNIGHDHDDDVPIDSNPFRRYAVRIWKRGRGYNVTVLNEITSDTDTITDVVLLPIGTVFRLYEVYRNIDWNSITID